MELLFIKEQVQNEWSFISRLNMHLETCEGFLCLVFVFANSFPIDLG
jgi:hypothetical protein